MLPRTKGSWGLDDSQKETSKTKPDRISVARLRGVQTTEKPVARRDKSIEPQSSYNWQNWLLLVFQLLAREDISAA